MNVNLGKENLLKMSSQLFESDFLKDSDDVKDLYRKTLFDLVENFISRPCKELRFQLIKLGFELSQSYFQLDLREEDYIASMNFFNHVVECLHSASLIVDDIQDQSKMRRGQKTLHEIYGIPLALNAGNWLYFYPLNEIENSTILNSNLKSQAIRECHKTLYLSHFGQALDLGALVSDLKKEQIKSVVHKTIEHKTGNLTALAMVLGALIVCDKVQDKSEKNQKRCADWILIIKEIGVHYGKVLQMYDDVSNLTSLKNPLKQFEDLKLLRPTSVWMTLSEILDENEYYAFIDKLIHHPENEFLVKFIADKNLIFHCNAKINNYRKEWMETFVKKEHLSSFNSIQKILEQHLERLSYAYN